MNISAISNQSIIGKMLRFPLRLIPQNMILPIFQGTLRGKKWIVGSGNHGFWLGCYEYEKQILFATMVKEGSVVYDISAHVGFYTLLASELVGSNGKVVAFEPLLRNIHYLKEHLRINRCDNVDVIEAAVTEQNSIALFKEGTDSSTGHISANGSIEVRMVSLDNLVQSGEIPFPKIMKIDVEGAELLVLSGAEELLAKYHPTIFLSTHGDEVRKQCCEFLKSLDYDIQSINKKIDEKDEILAFREK